MNHKSRHDRGVEHLVRANFFAHLADQLSLTAVPLLAVVHLQLNAGAVGMLGTFQALPYFLLSIPLGVIVDRVSKKQVMLVTETLRVLSLLGILALLHLNSLNLWSLCALASLAALGSVGFNAALPAYLPTLVERSEISRYNSRLELVRSISFAVGPALAGSLASWFGASKTFVLGLLLTGFTVLFISLISHHGRVAPSSSSTHPLRDVVNGANFVMHDRHLRAVMLVSFIWNTSWFVLQAAFMPIAIRTWGLSTDVVGYCLGCMGLGLLLGSFFSQRLIRFLGFGLSLAFGPVLSVLASSLILLNVQFGGASLPAIGFFLFGFGPVLWVITSNTLRQLVTPAHMLGCVSAMNLTSNWGARPIGGLLGAGLGTYFGETVCLVVSTILFCAQGMLVFTTGLAKATATTAREAS